MAVLGALSMDGYAVTLPQVTGVQDPPVGGVWVHPQRAKPWPQPQASQQPVVTAAATNPDSGPTPVDRSQVMSEQRHPKNARVA